MKTVLLRHCAPKPLTKLTSFPPKNDRINCLNNNSQPPNHMTSDHISPLELFCNGRKILSYRLIPPINSFRLYLNYFKMDRRTSTLPSKHVTHLERAHSSVKLHRNQLNGIGAHKNKESKK